MTDDYDRAMMARAARRGPVHVRSQGMWAAATLVGWHPADTTRGPNARIIWPSGRARTVRQADVALCDGQEP